MYDTVLVRELQCLGDLGSQRHRFGSRHRTARQKLLQRLAADQLHDEKANVAILLEPVNGGDAAVAQGGENPRLTFKARQPFGVLRKQFRQDLDGDLTAELGVLGGPDHPHPALANLLDEAVM